MKNKNITILIIALICCNSAGGFFTVICHGSDGHVAIEPARHNHCQCPESGEKTGHDEPEGLFIDPATGHEHCTDTIAFSNILIPERKNKKLSTQPALSNTLFLKTISAQSASFCEAWATQCNDLPSFFTPLRTIILLT